MTFRIAFMADTHLGYRARVRNNEKGVNIRVQDGYDALKEITYDILHSDVKIDLVLHGGDITHTSQPSIRDIVTANFYFRKIADSGIPIIGIGGNHDTSDIKAELPSVAAFHDPERGIRMIYKPYEKIQLADGLVLHGLSHHGLHVDDAPDVKVNNQDVNIFTAHGAALDPANKTLLRCMDSPREQIIPVELITDGLFDSILLGHYHSRHAVGDPSLNTWYSGSTVRRGFTDEPGARGWMLVEIEPDGTTTVTPQNIHQRPQFDLPVIDADSSTPSQIMDQILDNIDTTKDLDEAPIVRQKVINAQRLIREGIDYSVLKEKTHHMLSWQLEFTKPSETDKTGKTKISLKNQRSINIIDNYKRFTENQASKVPEQYRDIVVESAEHYLEEARDLTELEGR